MNNVSAFCRLIKRDAFHGPLTGIMKLQYHNVPSHNIQEETEPFSLINTDISTDSVFRWRNSGLSWKVLGSGIILLKNYINLIGQVEIVNICQKWGVGPGGFYEASRGLHRTCFGRNWDPATGYKNPFRSDGSEPPPIPSELISFTKGIFKYDFLLDGLPIMNPDICLVNFYSQLVSFNTPKGLRSYKGRYSLHQDCDESSDSLKRGLPVVSISIGDSAEFFYGHTRDENKLDTVLLESGDVLIFGGESRLIFHGVKRVVPRTTSIPLSIASRLLPGRLNLSLRQF